MRIRTTPCVSQVANPLGVVRASVPSKAFIIDLNGTFCYNDVLQS